MKQGAIASPDTEAQAPVGQQEPEPEETRECANCGGELRARGCGWIGATSYRCEECNAGGHITDSGIRHGPAFTSGWSV